MAKQVLSTGIHNDLVDSPVLVTYTDGTTAPLAAHQATVRLERLIDRSISHNEITHAPYSAELETALLERDDVDGYTGDSSCVRAAERGESLDAWGTTDDGDEWRIHLDRARDA